MPTEAIAYCAGVGSGFFLAGYLWVLCGALRESRAARISAEEARCAQWTHLSGFQGAQAAVSGAGYDERREENIRRRQFTADRRAADDRSYKDGRISYAEWCRRFGAEQGRPPEG